MISIISRNLMTKMNFSMFINTIKLPDTSKFNSKLLYFLIYSILSIGIMVRVFANGPGDLGSIPGQVIPKTQKMVFDSATLLNTQHYKVRIKGKVKQSRERSSALP